MPLVRVGMWAGVANDVKRGIAKGITDVIVDNVKCPVESVTIIFDEVPKENWVIGGRFCSDTFKDVK
jgi:4-oxalocrotonate tautomerase